MKKIILWALFLCLPEAIFAETKELRIVTLNGTVSEIVFALGKGKLVVGNDTSSLYPPEALALPKVGYQRALSAEGILSLKPNLILGLEYAGPPEVIEQLKSAGLKVIIYPGSPGVDPSLNNILAIGKEIGAEKEAQKIVKDIRNKQSKIAEKVSKLRSKPKILFVYHRGTSLAQVSGTETPADEMIRLAGGINAVNGFKGFKPITPEAVIAAQPDIILIPSRGLESLGGKDGVFSLPGVKDTPAGKKSRVVAIDDLVLLGFGPRLGQGIEELFEAFHSKTPDKK
ncbi:heme/hemin ABC transporter substrate-binding protein [Leptospira licerasiae]|uniref:Hemin-binding periplasmic protein HmuT n=1 Tax=Leptospira licerasiae str. MMD4847 TaxID=1049971 RepID=A0ABN0H4S4_9LEPT|nr:hemin ABC transporter substrate-binding protein [Leptospira licerasiae]EIE03277.1 putative hemin-binding periplasmic protein HmuT [Leptospira licerasiae serovar Varillal str. VAR 010]EJZ40682.1 putative hemin-binding periplasmic protein HmuT [Leptospira licerasiae str. MMD4847]